MNILDDYSPVGTTFLDICGGPGSFSEVLLNYAPKPTTGYGITLLDDNLGWYEQLLYDPNFNVLKGGPKGNGNICNIDTIKSVIEELKDIDINIVVCDGANPTNSNLHEILSFKLVFSEILLMTETLSENGHFVCKVFDTFSSFNASILYLLKNLFYEVYIVKPTKSRIVNSERYIVCKYYMGKKNVTGLWDVLMEVYNNLNDTTMVKLFYPINQLLADDSFSTSLSNCNQFLVKQQTTALNNVMNVVEEELHGSYD
eukprot:TRINITY_DN2333_c0_g1_i2.p1 TRINITY_DN2333_c0_g1~~TRINITY_DN2333_c0_g1_i2.p1  ORF type:complete len:257 (+),score=47.53 TRINITY_DN2333_c0_g1_i2:522-1292(+)